MKLAVFDLDGTLTATSDVDSECYVRAVRDVAGDIAIDEDWSSYQHTTDSGILIELYRRTFGREPRPDEWQNIQARFARHLRSAASDASLFAPVAGAQEILAELKLQGWRCAIATGAWQVSAAIKMDAAKLPALPMSSSDDAFTREQIVRIAIERAALHYRTVEFERVVSIGDAVWDVRTAVRMALPFVGMGRREAALRACGASHAFEDSSDITSFVRALGDARVPLYTP